MTRWQLTPDDPLALQLAADARLSQTDYLDDQAWELALGAPGSPALALQTNYGGRVGLASLVPLWRIDNRPIYEYQAYANPPVITTFAPGYAQATAKITPRLALRADFWVIDSHTVGARLTVRNSGAALDLGFDLIGFAAAQGKELKLSAFPLPGGGHALTFGKLGSINPVVVLESGRSSSPNTLSAELQHPRERADRRPLGSCRAAADHRLAGAGAELAQAELETRRCAGSARRRRTSPTSKRATKPPTLPSPSPTSRWLSRSSSRPPACRTPRS
ncbi:MAG: hypothetical protein U0521_17520 [Anaerolineae bacterium]